MAGVHEGGEALASLRGLERVGQYHVAIPEVALRAHVDVAERGYGDVLLFVGECRVEGVALLVVGGE